MADEGATWGQSDDDFELEVSALDTSRDTVPSVGPAGREVPNTAGSDTALVRDASWVAPDGDVGDTDVEAPWSQRLSPRRKLLAATTAAAVVVVTLLIVFSSAPGGGDGLWQTLHPPTATLAIDEDRVEFVHLAPWGALTVDGRHVGTALLSNAQGPAFIDLSLARGEHRLDYVAPPFRGLHCRVSVPRAGSDTCPLADHALVFQFQRVSALRVLDLQSTPSHLPPDQFQALARQVQQALAFAPGDVLAGDHYLQQDGMVVTASARLRAMLQVSLNADAATHFVINGEPCATLCLGNFGFVAPGGGTSDWNLVAIVRLAWQFADAAGQVVSTTPSGPSGPNGLTPLEVQVRWDGAWSVTPSGRLGVQQQTLSLLCLPATSQIIGLLVHGQNNQGFGINPQTGREPTDGCLLTAQQYPRTPIPPGTPVPPSATAGFLYRYGALIAADANAHRDDPQLPLPSANERAIIAEFVADQHTSAQQRQPAGSK